MALAVADDLALDFTLGTSGLTEAFVTLQLGYLYMEAAEEVGMETYDAANTLIDNFRVKRIIMQDASDQLNNWDYENDAKKVKPKLALSKESKVALHRSKGTFEQFDVVQRYSE